MTKKIYGVMPVLSTGITRLGCDPELFFTDKKGNIKGAEKVLPKNGISFGGGKIIIDGVQAELNPSASNCRQILANNIAYSFMVLNDTLNKVGKTNTNFSGVVKIEKRELDSLSDNSKTFGCMPSKNIYLTKKEAEIKVNPEVYLFRSAGGHIHIGHNENPETKKALKDEKTIVPLLDLIVGNTCVLIDRDPNMAERRKNYGRAGEYRTPTHGLEYRTLSNFWLRSYPLMSFVMSLARFAVRVAICSNESTPYAKLLLNKVKRDDVVKAINTNDLELAKKNFRVLEKFIRKYVGKEEYSMSPLNPKTLSLFHHFVKKGIKYWFKKDAMHNWLHKHRFGGPGWENFLASVVKGDKKAAKTAKK